MSFMEKQVTHKIEWIQLEGNNGITFVPAEDVPVSGLKVNESTDEDETIEVYSDYYDGSTIHVVSLIEGFGARLSAPGYMDCTDWSVFPTEAEAEGYLEENYPNDEEESEA